LPVGLILFSINSGHTKLMSFSAQKFVKFLCKENSQLYPAEFMVHHDERFWINALFGIYFKFLRLYHVYILGSDHVSQKKNVAVF